MDITDGDSNKTFSITCWYCYNDLLYRKKRFKSKIANLVKIIGQEELIYRTGVIQTIKFEPILD